MCTIDVIHEIFPLVYVINIRQIRRLWILEQSQLLWIKEDAGKGKTILTIGIINELKQQVANQGNRLSRKPSLLLAHEYFSRGIIYLACDGRFSFPTCGRSMTLVELFEDSSAFYSLPTSSAGSEATAAYLIT